MFNQLNPEKKRAYIFILSVSFMLVVVFQNFGSSDLGSALNSSENEIQQTQQNLNQDVHQPLPTQNRQMAKSGQVHLSEEPIRIKLKRAPARAATKKKKSKTKKSKTKKKKLKKSKTKAKTKKSKPRQS